MLIRRSLATRWDGRELMDDPDSDFELLRRTVRQFRLINRLLSRSRSLLRRWVLRDLGDTRECRVLELGGGDGELARWLYRAIARRGGAPEVESMDQDDRALRLAREADDGTPISLLRGRAPEELPEGPFEYVFGNLFIHHLSNTELVELLGELRHRGTKRCIFNDLYRGYLPLAAYSVFAGVFLRRSFAYYDGRASIRRGFRPAELETIAREAGWDRIRVFRRFPGHLVVVLDRNEAGTTARDCVP
ncbi:MAG: methyltransferase domain-containing protein [Spirochaetota bacterium]